MKFKVNVNFNISKQKITTSTRKSFMNHERRKHKHYRNQGIDHKLSKYNNYHDLKDYKKVMDKSLEPYVKHHNSLKSVKNHPQRRIKDVHQLLVKRGTKIPYRFIVFKFGDINTKKKMLDLFKSKGLNKQDYANAINKMFHDYATDFNQNSTHIKYDHEDTNLDEAGADHAHLGAMGISKTNSGNVSLSFDHATKAEYQGRNNVVSWRIMQNKEAHRLIHYANLSFQRYLGQDFSFQLQRKPNHNQHLEHNAYVRIQKANDRLSATNQRLSQALNAEEALNKRLDGENQNLNAEALEDTATISQYKKALAKAHDYNSKLQRLTPQEQNSLRELKLQSSNLTAESRELNMHYTKQSRKLTKHYTGLCNGLESYIRMLKVALEKLSVTQRTPNEAQKQA